MRQQSESMKETRREFTNELSQRGFQEGYPAVYKKGTDDTLDYTKKLESQRHMNFLNFLGKTIFDETSVEILNEARKGFLGDLNGPNHYIAKIYVTLIDVRLEELRQKPITSTPITPPPVTTKILTWDFSVVKSGPGSKYSSITTVRKGDKLTLSKG